MPVYTRTVAGFGTVTVDGTRPFVKLQEGGPSGAFRVVGANGADAKLTINGETQVSVFSDTKVSTTGLDAIIAAVNV